MEPVPLLLARLRVRAALDLVVSEIPTTPEDALRWLASRGAHAWLVRHHELVLEAAEELVQGLAQWALVFDGDHVLMGAAPAMQIDPILLLSATVLASSCGFMMPVATPPNTLVFAQKKFPVKDMLIAGFGLNLLAILTIPPVVLWIIPKVLSK